MKLTLEELKEIDREPFNEEYLRKIVSPSNIIPKKLQYIMCSLVSQYFKLFGSLYGINFEINIFNSFLSKKELEYEEDLFVWVNYVQELFQQVTDILHWKFIIIEYEHEYEHEEDDRSEGIFYNSLKHYLKLSTYDEIEKKIIWKNRDILYETNTFLDYGYCVLLYNPKLREFRQESSNYKNICKEESDMINSLLSEVWIPFYYDYSYRQDKIRSLDYVYYEFGDSGESTVGFETFNPNWICKAFVLDQLLDLALDKIKQSSYKIE